MIITYFISSLVDQLFSSTKFVYVQLWQITMTLVFVIIMMYKIMW